MLWHDLRVAWRSIRQNPFIAALIAAVIAVGIGTSVVAITLYHAKAGNPIWWKNDVLFRVLVDSDLHSRVCRAVAPAVGVAAYADHFSDRRHGPRLGRRSTCRSNACLTRLGCPTSGGDTCCLAAALPA